MTCFTALTVFYMHETSSDDEFNFHVDRSLDPNGKVLFKHSHPDGISLCLQL